MGHEEEAYSFCRVAEMLRRLLTAYPFTPSPVYLASNALSA